MQPNMDRTVNTFKPIKDTLLSAIYYAPRGRFRLYSLGRELAQRYLYPTDLLIGIIGPEGVGKSTLIQGIFPGLELTNDDEGVNIRSTPIFNFSEGNFFSGHTFHIDIRYESAFHQTYEIVEAINRAIANQRRVVVEHFDLIYKYLGYNAQIIFAIGEDVSVYRPSILGPSPIAIKRRVDRTVKYRLMAHSAEDITCHLLRKDYKFVANELHSDVRHGFVVGFDKKPKIDIGELEQKVLSIIEQDLKIHPEKGDYISLSGEKIFCTGKRIHVKSSGQIEKFRLIRNYIYDPISRQSLLVGLVGREKISGLRELPPIK
ncbi:MAG: hypothetical protein L0Y36_10460 [Planctomycetales bacterium]|nr:hypothetical protein [Planctomycetales bacterium]